MRTRKKSPGKLRRWIVISITSISAFAAIDLLWFCFVVDVQKLEKVNPEKTAFMIFREHQWKEQGRHKKINQQWVPLSRIAPCMRRAVVISEDAKFWKHDGFDFEAIQFAIEKNIEERKFKIGASTISQQLIKNIYLSPVKSPLRKINEAILTWRMEHVLTKRRILELYLNVAEWGDGVFGIEAAAHVYFGKNAVSLTPLEAAKLAAVLPNPIRFSPVKYSRYVDRRSRLIERMLVKSSIITAAIEHAVKDTLTTSAGNGEVNAASLIDVLPQGKDSAESTVTHDSLK